MLASFIGRLPVGMSMLMFILVVHTGTGSYAIAGLAAAANTGATAIFAPPLGRLSDRGHAAIILVVSGILQAASLVGLIIALRMHLDNGLIVGIGAISGIVNPPIAAVARTVLPRLAPDEETRTTAFALDALIYEMTFVIGPAFVGIVSALAGAYSVAYVAAAFNVIGAFWVAATKPVRHGYPEPEKRTDVSRLRRLIGPLTSRGLRTVLIVSILQAAAFGILEVAIPAYTNASGLPQAGGLLFAVWSCGSIVGGIWYGGQDFRAPMRRQYLILMLCNVVGFGSLLLAQGPYTLGILLFFAGLFIAPTNTVEGSLVTQLVPSTSTTEAFTWSGTAIYLGFALGSGGGALVLSSSLGSTSALTSASLLAVGLAALGSLLTIIERRSLQASDKVLAA